MATPVKLQRLSKYDETSDVLEWFKSPGETVREGEPLLAVSSDKATVEIDAPSAGVLLKIVVAAGGEVPAGAVLAWIGQPGEQLVTEDPRVEPAAGPLGSPISGETLAADQSKRALRGKAKAAPAARRLAREHHIQLEELSGSGPGGTITQSDVEKAIPDKKRDSGKMPGRKISPVARRLAKEHGLNIDQIDGTGPGGTITKADVQRLLRAPLATQPATAEEESLGEPERTVLPLGGLRRVMAQRMTTSHQSIVQATTVADVDMTDIVRLRERIPASYTAFVVKAAARATAEYPLINASLEDDKIVLHKHVHMGVAVTLDDGLLVPVIRHADGKPLAQIHQEIKDLAERARSRDITAGELSGPTMTVTNSGVFGSLFFTPIIVAPQSATLGMGKVAPTPVVRDGQIAIRDVMYLCLSYDHRFLDGAIAVRYLQKVRAYLEDPITLLWDENE